MKYLSAIVILITTVLTILANSAFSQPVRVAILDFENTSEVSKYDGLGKALGNMLITDLKNKIPRSKVIFFERTQLNKILSEQNLQKGLDFDRSTAVSIGKLAGVDYVILGSLYVLNGTCNISSRMVSVETSEIVGSKESNGQIEDWLQLKNILAIELGKGLQESVAYTDEGRLTVETVLTYSKAIEALDNVELDSATFFLRKLELSNLDSRYIEQLERQMTRSRFTSTYIRFKRKLSFDPNCELLTEIAGLGNHISGYGIGTPQQSDVELLWNCDMDDVQLMEYIERINKKQSEIGLPEYEDCESYQKDVYNRLLGFKESVDIMLSTSFKGDCFYDPKEFIIGSFLASIREHYKNVTSKNHGVRHEELFETFKIYYLKLVELNPNSSQFQFESSSFSGMKENYNEFLIRFKEVTH